MVLWSLVVTRKHAARDLSTIVNEQTGCPARGVIPLFFFTRLPVVERFCGEALACR